MNARGARWIGGGIVAAIVVPVVASLGLALAHVLGIPVGDLGELPTMMIVLWGPVFATILTAPTAFVLGAWAARRAEQQLISAQKRKADIVARSVVLVAAGGAIWGAVLVVAGTLGWEIGWALVPVGAMAGAVGGALVAWVVLSDAEHQSHAA